MTALCGSFRQLAGQVWRDRRAAEDLGVPWNEEPVTEWLLLQLARRHKGPDFDIRAFTKAEETHNGADWEFWFADSLVGFSVRIQAKRLFASGRYESLFKPAPNKFAQLDQLVARAGAASPLYVFYNYADVFPSPGFPCPNPRFRASSYWGCSIADPGFVRWKGSDKAAILGSGMLPWHCLVCHCPHCSNGGGGSPTLPHRIAGALNSLPYGRGASDGASPGRRRATPGESRPDWVDQLLGEDINVELDTPRRNRLTEYLQKKELAGVATIRDTRRRKE